MRFCDVKLRRETVVINWLGGRKGSEVAWSGVVTDEIAKRGESKQKAINGGPQ